MPDEPSAPYTYEETLRFLHESADDPDDWIFVIALRLLRNRPDLTDESKALLAEVKLDEFFTELQAERQALRETGKSRQDARPAFIARIRAIPLPPKETP